MKKKILIVEDDVNILELISYNLVAEGYEVIKADNGIKGMALVYSSKPDLILLDIMLPGKNGYEICNEIRESNINIPIIMITAKTGEEDKIRGLTLGADDYISKPFGIGELKARIKAILRRYYYTSVEELNSVFTIGDFNIDIDRHKVLHKGNEIVLTAKEMDILMILASKPGKVFSRDAIIDAVWGEDYFGDTRTLDVHIRHLRKKLNDQSLINTIRGKGYSIREK